MRHLIRVCAFFLQLTYTFLNLVDGSIYLSQLVNFCSFLSGNKQTGCGKFRVNKFTNAS